MAFPERELQAMYSDGPGDSPSALAGVSGRLSTQTLCRIAFAKSIGGNALRLAFRLTDTQRAAIGTFLDRIQSDDPGRLAAR